MIISQLLLIIFAYDKLSLKFIKLLDIITKVVKVG